MLAAAFGASIAMTSAAHAAPAIESPAGGYPDGRAPELVSTGDQNGGQIQRMWPILDDADRVMLFSGTGNVDGSSASGDVASVATRTAAGWQRRDVSPYAFDTPGGINVMTRSVAPDFSRSIVTSTGQLTEDDEDRGPDYDVFGIDLLSGGASLLSREDGVPVDPSIGLGDYIGSSRDGRTAVFSRTRPLMPTAPTGVNSIYRSRDGQLELISILPNGQPANPPGRSVHAPVYWDRGLMPFVGTSGQSPLGGGWFHNVSDDGSRVFFYSGAGSSQNLWGSGLYVRDGDQTLAVSASRRPGDDAEAALEARFIGATADGSVAFFASREALTPDAVGGGIYRFEISGSGAGQLQKLTGDVSATFDATSALVSDAGSTVYFVSPLDLAPGAGSGRGNVYSWDAEEGLRLVESFPTNAEVVRVSRDGRFAVIASSDSVAGADTAGTTQYYRFDTREGTLRCASCRSDGTASSASASLFEPVLGVASTTYTNPRAITDDGHVFFMTRDSLVTEDVGGLDVYEFDGERPALLSAGRGGTSILGDNTNDGSTVFISTGDRLTADDTDANEYDMYALRVGGGFPGLNGPSETCSGDECQGPATGEPRVPGPSSSAPGAGNVTPRGSVDERPSITIGRLSARTLRRAAASGTVRMTVTVAGPAAVRVRATSRIKGKQRAVASTSKRVAARGARKVAVSLRLTRAAKAELRRAGRLRVRVTVRASSSANRSVSFTLKRSVGR